MLRIAGVSAAIGGVQVLRSVSLGLRSGKTTILIGRNGAGKTKTLRAIMGLLPVQGGSARLDGEEIGTTPAAIAFPSEPTSLLRLPRRERTPRQQSARAFSSVPGLNHSAETLVAAVIGRRGR